MSDKYVYDLGWDAAIKMAAERMDLIAKNWREEYGESSAIYAMHAEMYAESIRRLLRTPPPPDPKGE